MWYSKVVASLGNIPDFIQHYERELEENESKRMIRILNKSYVQQAVTEFVKLLKQY